MSNFEDYLRCQIRQNGPMDVGTFMALAVGHYYGNRDPFGVSGDFITAPEISQMFGEMIGVWIADLWIKLGQPKSLVLVECGPGRGTLMADALRATQQVPGFQKAVKLLLLETSSLLRERQKETLAGYDVSWSNNLNHPFLDEENLPVIIIGNEFFDALPIRQVQMTEQGWKEKVVVLDGDDFSFALAPAPGELVDGLLQATEGDVYEVAPARTTFAENIALLINKKGGGALFIDYGYDGKKPEKGDTLQAVKGHGFVPVLSDIGEADLTSHVDFGTLRKAVLEQGVAVWGSVEQGTFLHNLGIDVRANILAAKATNDQKKTIEESLSRLCGVDQMGSLFKVMAITSDSRIRPAGF